MAEAHDRDARLVNPFYFHLQKLGLELKCPVCMNLLSKPVLLPCNHLFCGVCVTRFCQSTNRCPSCQQHYADQEISHASYMEDIVNTYRSLDATFSSTILPFLSAVVKVADKRGETNHRGGEVQATQMSPGDTFPDSAIRGDSNEEMPQIKVENLGPVISPLQPENAVSHSLMKSTHKHRIRKSGRVILDIATDPMDDEDICNMREPKKRKKVKCELPNRDAFSRNDECRSKKESLITSTRKLFDGSGLVGSACAFCQSLEITEATGPLLHFVNGREVALTEINCTKAVIAHIKCIEWTPKVYFVGEKIKNLKSELVRASKLKCSVCGLNGASLGCFDKSCCRSYHFPCTLEIPDCRWDPAKFLMLCPTHKHLKFPNEMPKARKPQHEIICSSEELTSEQSTFWASFPNGRQEWVFCGSSLSSKHKSLLKDFATHCGATLSNSWNPNVTHVIASTDENGAFCRTLKVLMAILAGKWIVNIDWVKTCLDQNHPVNEELFEINIDNHGIRDAPKTGRLKALSNAPKLFSNVCFYFYDDFDPSYKSDLMDLVKAGGGSIAEKLPAPENHPQPESSTFIVYFNDYGRERSAEELLKKKILQTLAESQNVAVSSDALQIMPHTLILESIAACRVLNSAFELEVLN